MLWQTGTQLEAFVAGEAKAKGSLRAFTPKGWSRPIITDQGGKPLKLYASSIAQAARAEMERRDLVVTNPDQPIEIHMVFYKPRPRGHFTASGALKANAPAYPTTKPDFDKLARAVCDALTGVVYGDDARIPRAVIEKRFVDASHPEGTWFRVRALAATLAELQAQPTITSPAKG